MIKIAGRWELEWNTPIKEVELWNLLLRDHKISDWYMFPITGIKHIEAEWVNLHERETFRDILDENQDLVHVYFEPYNVVQQKERGIDLREFNHPKDVMYIFGSAHFNPARFKRDTDLIVQIPTIQNEGVLWPHQCLAVCLYDRLNKNQWQ
jgi:hypothetical protein